MSNPSGFYGSDHSSNPGANQPLGASTLHHRVDQLTAIVSQQQAVIAEFMKESRDFQSIVTSIESNVTTLGSNMLELKDAFTSSTRPKKEDLTAS